VSCAVVLLAVERLEERFIVNIEGDEKRGE
jgi:hypothetical protein